MDGVNQHVRNKRCSSVSSHKDSMTSGGIDASNNDRDYNPWYQCYRKQYMNLTSWFMKCQRKFCLHASKSDFHEWCRLLSEYHAAMASDMQRNYFHAVAAGQMQPTYCWNPAALQYGTIQTCMPSGVSNLKPHNKCGKSQRRRRRHSRARKQSHHLSAGDIELHIANIDPAGGKLEVGLADENMEFEFEVTEDLLEFFAETARHRKQRERMKVEQLTQEKNEEITSGTLVTGTAVRLQATVRPPSEQLGARRLVEMRELYGAGAAMIHGMETAMQLSFDRNTDRYKPRPWPALPLNIQFD